MKKWIFLGVGLVLGAGIGVLSTRGYYRKLAFDEINEARATFRKMTASKEAANRNDEMKKKIVEKDDPEESGKTGKVVQNSGKKADFSQFSEIIKPYTGEKVEKNESAKQNYNVFSNPPNADELDISDDEEEEENAKDPYELTVDHEAPKENGYSQPYHITEEEFASDKMFYDKVMIEYYDDGVAVLEDSDQIIDCIEDLIGPDILPNIDNNPQWIYNDNETYVRNDSRSSDYGIIFTGTNFVPKEEL